MAASDDHCYVRTVGRRSGRVHEIEIWYARAGDVVHLLAGGGWSSDWVCNLAATPDTEVRVDGSTWRARARVLTDQPVPAWVPPQVVDGDAVEQAAARRSVHAKYRSRGHGDLSSWRDRALVVALDLLGPAGGAVGGSGAGAA